MENKIENIENEENVKSKICMKKKKLIKLHSISYLESFTKSEIFEYLENLHKFINRQKKKLKKYKIKIKLLEKSQNTKCSEKSTSKESQESQIDEKEKTTNFIDDIREAAESVQNQNGFIYEPTSGLYYDQKTGYYYNAEYGLYYDGNNGCYYKYDQEKNEFEFHSQVQVQPENEETDKVHENFYINNLLNKFSQLNINKMRENALDIAQKYPPSMRIIVQETNLPKLKVGALHIITFKGGTLGREGDHDVIIPDLNVSKYHLKFLYNEDKTIYQCIDLGSQNGTILNGKRISNAKQESEPNDVVHGSVLQLSQTKLLCHIHKGNSTCGHCEPGLIIEEKNVPKITPLTHKEQLKKLQKRYGLENEKYINTQKSDSQYNDRSAVRRDQIGSTNDCEKTQTATLDTEISSDNKGFKMLSKLGWNKGETLGKTNEGLLEPVNILSNEGTKGLGCQNPVNNFVQKTKKQMKNDEKWRKTQNRYKKLEETNIFEESTS